MNVEPNPGCIYVEAELETPSAIIIPDNLKERSWGGKIVAIAAYKRIPSSCCPSCCPGFKKGMDVVPMELKMGQFVTFRPRSADVFSIAGRTFYNVKEDDCLLVFDDQAAFQQVTPMA